MDTKGKMMIDNRAKTKENKEKKVKITIKNLIFNIFFSFYCVIQFIYIIQRRYMRKKKKLVKMQKMQEIVNQKMLIFVQ